MILEYLSAAKMNDITRQLRGDVVEEDVVLG